MEHRLPYHTPPVALRPLHADKSRASGQGDTPEEKRILHGVDGSIPEGALCALMGPSNSGERSLEEFEPLKTTPLSVFSPPQCCSWWRWSTLQLPLLFSLLQVRSSVLINSGRRGKHEPLMSRSHNLQGRNSKEHVAA